MERKNVFSLSEREVERIDNNQNKIELLNCQLESQKCKDHLSLINTSYCNAYNYHLEKDYLHSIESLKSAFYKASELHETPCSKCAALFQSTITQSLKNINKELYKMTNGVFKRKRFLFSYIESCNALKDFKQKD